MSFRDDFTKAVREKKLVEITAKTDDEGNIKRKCVPLEYGPGIRPRDGVDYFHLFDIDSPAGPHPLTLLPSQVLDLAVLTDTFDPGQYVRGKSGWYEKRDPGK